MSFSQAIPGATIAQSLMTISSIMSTNTINFWQRLPPNSELKRVFAPIAGEVEHVWTRDIFRNVFRHHADQLYRPEDYINHSLYLRRKPSCMACWSSKTS